MSIHNLTGQTLGQYELRELLGAGGMGAVYRGYQTNLKRYVAVKVMSADLAQQAGYLERFTREAETSAALDHPHIITIHDYGIQQGISYLVMQLLTGGTLSERIAQRANTDTPLPSLGEIADLLQQIGSALDYAHSQDVIHRDIKASNVMFDNHGNAYLMDFGIAKLATATRGLTATGMVIGTWSYMAPEQWRNEGVSPATDQYALGVMTYALVTGQMPFEADTPASMMHCHLTERPVPPHAFRPDVPDTLADVLERALAKARADRFSTCTAFAQAFDSAIRGNTGEKTNYFTAPLGRRMPRAAAAAPGGPSGAGTAEWPIYRHPAMWLASAVIVVLVGALLLTLLGGGDGAMRTTTDAARGTETSTATAESAIVLVPSDTPEALDTSAPTPTDMPVPTLTATAPPSATSTPSTTPAPTATPMPRATWTPTFTHSATSTADPREAARATRDAMLTQTATQWTPTPTHTRTPTLDWDATVAGELTALYFDDQTATATLWTATPSATPDSLQVAWDRAVNFSGSNNDWEPFVGEFDGVEMVLVPVGCFEMGSTDEQVNAVMQQCNEEWRDCERFEAESPAHQVCFEEPFWIDRYEVTIGQFAAFGGQAVSASYFSGDDRPREQITWFEARDFCESRSARLPTEAEWEYAARGPEAWDYPWGDEWDQGRVIGYREGEATASVGSRPESASWVGALDMSGNVWEWVADWHSDYATFTDGAVNPTGPESGEARVLRGGSWDHDDAGWFRAAIRVGNGPETRDLAIGFRCARSR